MLWFGYISSCCHWKNALWTTYNIFLLLRYLLVIDQKVIKNKLNKLCGFSKQNGISSQLSVVPVFVILEEFKEFFYGFQYLCSFVFLTFIKQIWRKASYKAHVMSTLKSGFRLTYSKYYNRWADVWRANFSSRWCLNSEHNDTYTAPISFATIL